MTNVILPQLRKNNPVKKEPCNKRLSPLGGFVAELDQNPHKAGLAHLEMKDTAGS